MMFLRAKAALVGTPFEGIAKHARQVAATLRPNLELAEVLLEERRLPQVLSRLLKPDSHVLDIGCHIGSFLSLASTIATNGRHTAIEASPTKAALLKKKFPNVNVLDVAISDRDGTATFEEDLARPGWSRLAGTGKSGHRIDLVQVKTATLDSLQLGRFDLVKIDIEGAELLALQGGEKFFANQPALIFECGATANIKVDRAALFDHLTSKIGYSVFTFEDFLYRKGQMSADEFRKAGVYPFKAFNFLAVGVD
jgi:FkbM family methyltransferase